MRGAKQQQQLWELFLNSTLAASKMSLDTINPRSVCLMTLHLHRWLYKLRKPSALFFTLHHPGRVESGRLIGCCRLAEDSLALCLERSPARRPKDRRSPSVLFNKKGAPLFLPSAAAPLKAESLGASHQHPAPLLRNPLLQKLVFYQNPSHFNFLFFCCLNAAAYLLQ